MSCRRLLWLVAVVVAVSGRTHAVAGISYQNPSGGWTYTYGGTFNAPVVENGFVGGVGPAGYGRPNDSEALDGTWYHDQSDKWDGSGPGDTGPTPNGPAPGGASSLTETGTTFIRVQDAGNPEAHGFVQGTQDPVNTNRRVYFGHSIADDYGGAGEPAEPPSVNGRHWQRLLDNGITVSFRMRIPYLELDPIYTMTAGVTEPWLAPPEADYNSNGRVDAADYVLWRKGGPLANEVDTPGTVNAADYTEWRKRFGNQGIGRGYPIHDDGRSMVTVMQHNGDENDPFYGTDGTVAFSLVTSKDIENLCTAAPGATICSGNGSGGLIMNNGSGDTPSQSVDSFDAGQTLNIVPIADDALDDWHEFWITIVDPNQSDTNNSVMGIKTVNVYMDGSTTPTTFQVSMSGNNNGAYGNFNAAFLEFGLSSTDLFGSFDMDFVSYKHGVITPVAAGAGMGGSNVPEPTAIAMALLGILTALITGAARSERIESAVHNLDLTNGAFRVTQPARHATVWDVLLQGPLCNSANSSESSLMSLG